MKSKSLERVQGVLFLFLFFLTLSLYSRGLFCSFILACLHVLVRGVSVCLSLAVLSLPPLRDAKFQSVSIASRIPSVRPSVCVHTR